MKRRHVVIPTSKELQIDLDSDAAYKIFKKRLNFFRNRIWAYHSLRAWRLRVKTTRSMHGNRHITIKLSHKLSVCERICAQLLLGDDPNRGMYNFFRHLNGSRFPILFFELSDSRTRRARRENAGR